MNKNQRVQYNTDELQLYKKRKKNIHFVKSLNVKEFGESIVIHTLEGDVTIQAGEDIYIMLGDYDDIYPIPRNQFESKYQAIAEKNLGKVEELARKNDIPLDKIEGCCLVRDYYIYAKQVNENFVVPSKGFDYDYAGNAGDYYVVSCEDRENVYIIQKDIMNETYEKIEEKE